MDMSPQFWHRSVVLFKSDTCAWGCLAFKLLSDLTNKHNHTQHFFLPNIKKHMTLVINYTPSDCFAVSLSLSLLLSLLLQKICFIKVIIKRPTYLADLRACYVPLCFQNVLAFRAQFVVNLSPWRVRHTCKLECKR